MRKYIIIPHKMGICTNHNAPATFLEMNALYLKANPWLPTIITKVAKEFANKPKGEQQWMQETN